MVLHADSLGQLLAEPCVTMQLMSKLLRWVTDTESRCGLNTLPSARVSQQPQPLTGALLQFVPPQSAA
jgi:hypothetical protein